MSTPSDPNQLIVFDTTLRDGEQSPGCSMHTHEKLRVGEALAALGVDVIEAGFPIASQGDFESVREIARRIEGPTIAGLARCQSGDIDRAWEAVKDNPRPRIHVFLATSAIHREHKLKMAKEEIVRRAVAGVERAREHCEDVEFSPEDASRTEPDFLAEVVEKAIEAGATTLNIPDTVGYSVPHEYGEVFAMLRRTVRGIEHVVLSAHCHDDLGLAVANSLAAVQNGARQVECTINGIGERAGNAALEEIVMGVRMRGEALDGVTTTIETERLCGVSRMLAMITGTRLPRNKAIVGANAFAHESGIHQHGVLSSRATYEIMDPKWVGADKSQLVLGKHSGKHAVRDRVRALGYSITEESLEGLMPRLKALADRKKSIYDRDLEALLVEEDDAALDGPWKLERLHTSAGTDSQATATVVLTHAEGGKRTEAAVGDGPVHAVFESIRLAAGVELSLKEFEVRNLTAGEDAQGEAIVDVTRDGRTYRGRGLSTDIIEASAEAILDVVNRLVRMDARAEDTTIAYAGHGAD
ncbi:MAG: 2-isopropylmalate synthase [Planctomycetota bacterium]